MTRLFRLFPLLHCFLAIIFANQNSGTYMINLIVNPDSIPQQHENDLIRGETDSLLFPLTTQPKNNIRPGQLLMRQRINSKSAVLYYGLFDTAAFRKTPPLFSFDFPHWARLQDMLTTRFYRAPTEQIGTDEPTIYCDKERLYARAIPQLYYYRHHVWFPLRGSPAVPSGALKIVSHPPGATVIINGEQYPRAVTPCTIPNLLGGIYTVELQLANHQFFNKKVAIFRDSTSVASYELIADVDTVFITGKASYGLLLLPEPPLQFPYTIDDSITITDTRIRITPGTHRVVWQGDERFASIDTMLDIPEGKVVYFDYLFKRQYGIVRIIPHPADAEICIDAQGCTTGEMITELPAGLYHITAYRHGFLSVKQDLHLKGDTITSLDMDLRQVPDSDGDGYIDSSDNCPNQYGLYHGCPHPQLRSALQTARNDIAAYARSDELKFGVSLLGIISRTPSNTHFRNLLSVFSSGRIGGVNNYRGLTFLNSLLLMYRGFYSSVELGQWTAGLHYQRPDTLHLDSNTIFYFDSLNHVEPTLFIPSTALCFGVHYSYTWFNLSYAIGYQWEDLIFDQLYNVDEARLFSVTFNNDFWFHQISLEVDFNEGDFYVPSLYCKLKLPFGTIRHTPWQTLQAGLQLKLFTHPAGRK